LLLERTATIGQYDVDAAFVGRGVRRSGGGIRVILGTTGSHRPILES
jgi:hypothetical protein